MKNCPREMIFSFLHFFFITVSRHVISAILYHTQKIENEQSVTFRYQVGFCSDFEWKSEIFKSVIFGLVNHLSFPSNSSPSFIDS